MRLGFEPHRRRRTPSCKETIMSKTATTALTLALVAGVSVFGIDTASAMKTSI